MARGHPTSTAGSLLLPRLRNVGQRGRTPSVPLSVRPSASSVLSIDPRAESWYVLHPWPAAVPLLCPSPQSADVLPWWMRRSAGAHAAPRPCVLARARIRSRPAAVPAPPGPWAGGCEGASVVPEAPGHSSQASLPAPPGRPICHGRHPIVLPRRRGALRLLWTERGRETILAWGGAGRPEPPGDRLPPSSPPWVPLPLVAPAPRARAKSVL